jgi:hypothetical protein
MPKNRNSTLSIHQALRNKRKTSGNLQKSMFGLTAFTVMQVANAYQESFYFFDKKNNSYHLYLIADNGSEEQSCIGITISDLNKSFGNCNVTYTDMPGSSTFNTLLQSYTACRHAGDDGLFLAAANVSKIDDTFEECLTQVWNNYFQSLADEAHQRGKEWGIFMAAATGFFVSALLIGYCFYKYKDYKARRLQQMLAEPLNNLPNDELEVDLNSDSTPSPLPVSSRFNKF